jgi:MerR family transcriptional regulator, light-induced transcriptional regulator
MREKKGSRGAQAGAACEAQPLLWPGNALDGAASPLSVMGTTLGLAKERVSRLARTLQSEVIPRLVEHHRAPLGQAQISAQTGSEPTAADVDELVSALIADSQAENRVSQLTQQLQARGVTVESLFMDLLTPAARQLGEMWEEDRCDFTTVTVALGRLQRLLRLLSPAFGSEIQHPISGRRVLLTQPSEELHMFGLSMVAEFFRRDGWDVLGGVPGVGIDAAKWVGRDWFDVVGFSMGHESRLPWVRDLISDVRAASRNRGVVILVGGPVFSLNPAWAEEVGADATTDGKNAPSLAESLVLRRSHEPFGAPGLSAY